MGALILTLVAAFLPRLSCAAEIPLDSIQIPGHPVSTDTAAMDFNQNPLGVHDLMPAPRKKGEVRAILLSGTWVAGHELPIDATMAKRMGFYLKRLTRKKFEVINGAMTSDSPIELLPKLPALLEAYKPDYVFFYYSAGTPLVNLGALDALIDWDESGKPTGEHFFTERSLTYRIFDSLSSLSPEQKQVWLRLLNLQAGMVKFSRRISKTANQPEELLAPLIRVIKQMQMISDQHKAKFVFLWPTSAVRPADWNKPRPQGQAFSALGLVDPLKYPVTVVKEKLLEVLRQQKIPMVVNYEIGNYLYSFQTDTNARKMPYLDLYKTQVDHMAELLATSILSQEL